MFGTPFYNETVKKIVAIFGGIFNEISIEYVDELGDVIRTHRVPISFSPRSPFLARMREENSADSSDEDEGYTRVRFSAPAMGFELTDITYDPNRQKNKHNRLTPCDAQDASVSSSYQRTPYNIGFALYIYAKKYEESLKILEQILPFFDPEFTVPMEALASLGIKEDLKFRLESVSPDDNYEAVFDDQREVIWTLNFEVETFLYKPVVTASTIQTVITNINIDLLNEFIC